MRMSNLSGEVKPKPLIHPSEAVEVPFSVLVTPILEDK